MKKGKKLIIICIAAVLVIAAGFGGKYLLDLKYYNELMPTVQIGQVDIADLRDGNYTGSFNARIIAATVEVAVNSGKITDITLLKHKFERGKPAEVIIEKVKEEQTLQVDVISGATNSSKTILKAIENALNSK